MANNWIKAYHRLFRGWFGGDDDDDDDGSGDDDDDAENAKVMDEEEEEEEEDGLEGSEAQREGDDDTAAMMMMMEGDEEEAEDGSSSSSGGGGSGDGKMAAVHDDGGGVESVKKKGGADSGQQQQQQQQQQVGSCKRLLQSLQSQLRGQTCMHHSLPSSHPELPRIYFHPQSIYPPLTNFSTNPCTICTIPTHRHQQHQQPEPRIARAATTTVLSACPATRLSCRMRTLLSSSPMCPLTFASPRPPRLSSSLTAPDRSVVSHPHRHRIGSSSSSSRR